MSYSVRQNPVQKHYTEGRQGKAVNKIIVHHAATTDFDGIARTFNGDREASAHWAVGRNNNVDALVDEANTAWHCGNWQANLTSVGIENVNLTGAPNWDIADATFNTLVELVRDIRDRHGLGKLVVGQNLFGHRDFMATACPGQLYGRLQELADRVNGGSNPAPNPDPGTPAPGRKSNEEIADEVLAGSWGNNPQRRDSLIAAGYDYAAIQAVVNSKVGQTPAAPRKSDAVVAAEVMAGAWGNGDDRKNRLQGAGYDYDAIQSIVNGKVAETANHPVPQKYDDNAVADQIIAGAWGNGDDRRNRLVAAGYDFNAVQTIVNEKLGQRTPSRKTDDQIANEVIAGSWSNGQERKDRLAAAGYDYGTIQSLVNRKLGF